MEQFLIDNAERYKKLVAAFKPSKSGPKESSSEAASPEIVVSARVRPMLEDETAQGFPAGVHLRAGDTNIVDLHELQQPVRGLPRIRVSVLCLETGVKSNIGQSSDYEVDRVFGPDSTTAEIYDSLVKPLVPWAWGGGIGTMFAYGQTASGKTLTVTGIEKLVAEDLMDGSLDGDRKISISIIELAGQTAYGESN